MPLVWPSPITCPHLYNCFLTGSRNEHESVTTGRHALKQLAQEELSCWRIWKQVAWESTRCFQRRRFQPLQDDSILVSDNNGNTGNHKGDSSSCLEHEDFSVSRTHNFCQNRCLHNSQNQSRNKPVCVKCDLCVFADTRKKSSLCKQLKSNKGRPTDVRAVGRDSAVARVSSFTAELTRERNLTSVRSVGKASPEMQIFMSIPVLTLERSLVCIRNMEKAATRIPTFKSIRIAILKRSNSNVKLVGRGTVGPRGFMPTREFILERNHTNVKCVGRASTIVQILNNTK